MLKQTSGLMWIDRLTDPTWQTHVSRRGGCAGSGNQVRPWLLLVAARARAAGPCGERTHAAPPIHQLTTGHHPLHSLKICHETRRREWDERDGGAQNEPIQARGSPTRSWQLDNKKSTMKRYGLRPEHAVRNPIHALPANGSWAVSVCGGASLALDVNRKKTVGGECG